VQAGQTGGLGFNAFTDWCQEKKREKRFIPPKFSFLSFGTGAAPGQFSGSADEFFSQAAELSAKEIRHNVPANG